MLSTCHQPIVANIANHEEIEPIVQKPYAVKKYNLHMCGVEQVDHQLHSVRILRKAYRSHKKLALRLIQMCKNTRIERCYFSKVYAPCDCSYFAIVTKVE